MMNTSCIEALFGGLANIESDGYKIFFDSVLKEKEKGKVIGLERFWEIEELLKRDTKYLRHEFWFYRDKKGGYNCM